LFDEVEKAHPDVFNILLQVLDDGVLTDGQGRTVDFKQTIIILTSNLGTLALSQLPDGSDASDAHREVMDAVQNHFRPEFLNRLDETIIFDRLSRSEMDGIVDVQLEHLRGRLAHRNITLNLDQASKKWLADEGYDPVFGARPLKRVLQATLRNRLAEMLLANEVMDGDTVSIMAGPDGLIVGDRPSSSPRSSKKKPMVH
jgi:ATP-dependent Clp protease ATP-binding subunit ClpB